MSLSYSQSPHKRERCFTWLPGCLPRTNPQIEAWFVKLKGSRALLRTTNGAPLTLSEYRKQIYVNTHAQHVIALKNWIVV